MDEEEFMRRTEVYLEQELPDLAADKTRVAEAITRRLWPLVGGWQGERNALRETLAWVGQRLGEDWPDAAAQLSLEQTGAETGWP